MGDWSRYFKEAGGSALLLQYIRNRTFGIAVNLFLSLGRSKKALEILRLAVEFKFFTRLKAREKSYVCRQVESIRSSSVNMVRNRAKIIWICWWQGIENAPYLVKKCISSVCNNFHDWDIRVITLKNYSEYVKFPQFIVDKWEEGVISHTHMSDLLRLELLVNHGGLWLDSTIMVTSPDIPASIAESELFFYQTLKPGADGHTVLASNWLIYAKSNSCILRLTRDLLYRYWEIKNRVDDYFIMHYYLTIACEYFQEEYNKIPKFSNEIPHILLLNIFNQFDGYYWDDLKKQTCFHKLSYKLDPEKIKRSNGSYYDLIINTSSDEIS